MMAELCVGCAPTETCGIIGLSYNNNILLARLPLTANDIHVIVSLNHKVCDVADVFLMQNAVN
ncbi:hypothetical protein E2C01_070776 [Portunus trituberculatus]|uniref:Uncharacterized protein n=1 Tax=Portunus trituberculatus TaxID=210409 RepID=A0A5B7I347_PORTR|nr:hypothetical protein [Portunus trituberculatus]